MVMVKYVKWKDCSFLMKEGGWMPEAIMDVIDGDRGIHCNVLVGDRDFDMIKSGWVVFSTRETAKEAARLLVTRLARGKWYISEERLQEW